MKIEIDIPEGYEVDTENSTKECIKLKKIENKLPKTWKEFCKTHPIKSGEAYFNNNSDCRVIKTSDSDDRNLEEDKNILPSKKLAEAMLALCQLIQLRDCYNDGWIPDWEVSSTSYKYCLHVFKNRIEKCVDHWCNHILVFKTEELRDRFSENFKDLIEIAKPLL